MPSPDRRRFLRRLAASGLAAGLAGCSSGPDPPEGTDVIVGPGGRLTFEPPEASVPAGERLVWWFASPGHNVSCVPAHSDLAELPAGADPFASYGDGRSGSLEGRGATYAHAFVVSGTYRYVCIPHQGAGMVGTVHVG